MPEISLVAAAMTARIESLIDQLIARRQLRPVFVVPDPNLTSASPARRCGAPNVAYVLARHAANDQEESLSHET